MTPLPKKPTALAKIAARAPKLHAVITTGTVTSIRMEPASGPRTTAKVR